MKVTELTKRGRTSTISSGTRKMRAFNFLAIEIASLAVKTHTYESALEVPTNHNGRKLTVLLAILILAGLVDVQNKCRVHDARTKCLKQIEEEDTSRERRVFERSDGPHARLALLRSRVRPLEDFRIANRASMARLGQRAERLRDVFARTS